MNPKHVTSLETSMKLKEVGVPQVSEWYWCHFLGEENWRLLSKRHLDTHNFSGKNILLETISAFLSDELGEMLPDEILVGQCRTLCGWCRFDFGDQQTIVADTEPEARGKMLLYLIKEKLVSFEAKASESEGV